MSPQPLIEEPSILSLKSVAPATDLNDRSTRPSVLKNDILLLCNKQMFESASSAKS